MVATLAPLSVAVGVVSLPEEGVVGRITGIIFGGSGYFDISTEAFWSVREKERMVVKISSTG